MVGEAHLPHEDSRLHHSHIVTSAPSDSVSSALTCTQLAQTGFQFHRKQAQRVRGKGLRPRTTEKGRGRALTCRQEADELRLRTLLLAGLSTRPALHLLCRVQLAPHGAGEKNGEKAAWREWHREQGWPSAHPPTVPERPTKPPTRPSPGRRAALRLPDSPRPTRGRHSPENGFNAGRRAPRAPGEVCGGPGARKRTAQAHCQSPPAAPPLPVASARSVPAPGGRSSL